MKLKIKLTYAVRHGYTTKEKIKNKMFDIHDKFGQNSALIFGVIPVYSFFVALGIAAGMSYYFLELKRRGGVSDGAAKIVASALIFGALGAKIPLIFEGRTPEQILYGKSIIGGLIGGMFGVIFIKKLLKIKLRLGNYIAPAVALGTGIGRFGCYFNGCCYGVATDCCDIICKDFGDGRLRLPTQLFEAAFQFTAFLILHFFKSKVKTPGILFKIYLISYMIIRFLMEFIRENPTVWLSMSIYQIICIIGIFYMGILILKEWKRNGRLQ